MHWGYNTERNAGYYTLNLQRFMQEHMGLPYSLDNKPPLHTGLRQKCKGGGGACYYRISDLAL